MKATFTMLLFFLQPLWQSMKTAPHTRTTEEEEFTQICFQALFANMWQSYDDSMSAAAKAGEASALLCEFLAQTSLHLLP